MSSTITCSNCGHTIDATNVKPGDWTDCKKCFAKIIVPGKPTVSATAEPRPAPALAGLKSADMGRKVTYSLLVITGLDGFMVLLSLMIAAVPTGFESLADIGFYVWAITILADIGTAVLIVIWMYRVHVDLRSIWRDYPMSPKEAAQRLGIPIYNIFAGWKVFKTLTDKLAGEGAEQERRGRRINTLLNVAAFMVVATRIIYRLEPENPETVQRLQMAFIMEAGACLAWVVFDLLWVNIHKLITDALTVYVKRSPSGSPQWTEKKSEHAPLV